MTQYKDGPRPAVIGTCTLLGAYRSPENPPGADECLADGLAAIDRMAREAEEKGWNLDIVALPETFAHVSGESAAENAEPIDGHVITALAEKARTYRTYVAAPVQLRDGDTIYNSVVILDRKGEPIGAYHKVFPVLKPDGSLESGVMPGDRFPVFDLDFGRVGVQICWDIVFEEGWKALADQGAELVLFSTDPGGELGLRTRAWQHGYYIVGSTYRPPALVVAPTGREIARTSGDREVLVIQLDLDYRILFSNCLWTWGPSRRKQYIDRINLDWHDTEGMYLVTSLDPELSVGRFLEIEGLETGRGRLARNIKVLLAERGGPPKMPE